METFIIILLIALVSGIAYVIYLLMKKNQKTDDQSFLMLQNQLKEMRETLDGKLGESTKQIQMQFGQSAKIIQEVTERLTKLDDTNKQVVGFAEQLQSLENILKNPKQRGILGEYYLETLLKNILPPGNYEMQYKLGKAENGKDLIPDAVVFVKDKIIPVDSKFSLENYNKIVEQTNPAEKEKLEKLFINDLKQRIIETSKYIQPSMKTTDFAFMFIPHEAIYYDLLVNKVGAITDETNNILQRAASQYKVIIVSPTSFLAYLQTVMQGLKAMQIEEQAKEIIKNVELLSRHLLSYEDFMKKMGNNLGTTVGMYNSAYHEFKKIDKDVLKIAGTGGQVDPLTIDKPKME